MPSDAGSQNSDKITGRCYCGAHRFRGSVDPQIVAYCHCSDCRRVTGAPVAAFAAFGPDDLTFDPPLEEGVTVNPGVTRWFCKACGSPLAGQYDYLPRQIYVSLGLIDQADRLAPERHSHADSALKWLHIADDLPRDAASGRDALGSGEAT